MSQSTSSETVVRWEKKEGIATIWLCNPGRRNAMGTAFWEQLPQVVQQVGADEEVRVALLCAEGEHFTVGLDLKQMTGLFNPDGGQIAMRQRLLADARRLQVAISSVDECPVPVIVCLHGWCIGGGIDLACACDIRLAAADCKLSVRETRIGIVADLGTLQRMPAIVGRGHTAELAYTGRDITAEHAQRIGLVNEVYPDREALWGGARHLAEQIAENSPLVVRGVKNVLRYCADKSVADGLEYVAVWNSAFLFSEDLMEAMGAFLEKRKPNFKGR